MSYENLLYEKKDSIAYITFNRPKVLNALNRKTVEELRLVLTDARDDAAVRVLLLTGSGEKAFVAGADINELARQTPVNGKEFSLFGQGVFHLLETMGKPSICAINGFALGGGCELALCCSIRLASKTARLGQPEVKLGILPGYGGSQRMARLCGKGIAHEVCLTGEMITAEEAQRIGLVNRVYEPAELLPAAEAMAKKIIERAPLAVKYCMEAIERGVEMPLRRRVVPGGHALRFVLRHGRYARGNESVPGKASGAISGKMSAEMPGKLQPGKINGEMNAAGLRFAVVVSRFNGFITERLLQGAVDALERSGAGNTDVDVVYVPGAFELPLTAKKAAQSGRYDAIIAIGCVLRGETAHYDYVCSETARGLQLAQMDTGIPVMFCVLTCDTLEQAIDRAGLKGGNKGFEAGLGAVEMVHLSRKMRAGAKPAAPAKGRRK